ncbi:coiled-coil domain-containing protein 24 isoform X4 [Canis lupus dingo]|uniref:coiled-coil domain-containing protein 24 isoform X4 n=1 Tax=Canis lupus dingo TaxID=286419 RepID=UPI0020C42DA8|nr:coiled-coil domain-containing protein 24 isoform X4 [Canis lupus dingo]
MLPFREKTQNCLGVAFVSRRPGVRQPGESDVDLLCQQWSEGPQHHQGPAERVQHRPGCWTPADPPGGGVSHLGEDGPHPAELKEQKAAMQQELQAPLRPPCASSSRSSPWGPPAGVSGPCLASMGLQELGLGLSSAAGPLLLRGATPNPEAWPPPAAGDGSFSAARGQSHLLLQCPAQHHRPPPEGLVTRKASASAGPHASCRLSAAMAQPASDLVSDEPLPGHRHCPSVWALPPTPLVKSLVPGSDNQSLWPSFSWLSTKAWQAEVSSQPRLLSPWGTQTKHSSSSETGIEISLKSMDFKILVVHTDG